MPTATLSQICNVCKVDKDLESFHRSKRHLNGFVKTCKDCRKVINKNYISSHKQQDYATRTKYRKFNPVGYAAKAWINLNSRTINGSCPRYNHRSSLVYLNKGIELRISRNEFIEFIKANWDKIESIRLTGEKASIDRIDSNGHYELSNMRIISMRENSARVSK